MIGETLGNYKIIRKLGAGGMGEVYYAKDIRLGRYVALKVLLHELTADADRLRRFELEARATSALNHPNIVTIFEIGETDSFHYIVTEFIDGMTLRQYLAEQQLNLREMLGIAVQVASALAAAHALGYVHRDIKPENIMRRADGYIKVLDFGLTKLVPVSDEEVSDPNISTALNLNTDPGSVVGTVTYMSPEQLRGAKVDGRADIWSLGVVTYEMIAGRSPFGAASKSDMIAAILRADPPPLTRYSDVPDQLQRIVDRSLRKDREERYQSVKDLLIDLRDLQQDLELGARMDRIQISAEATDVISHSAPVPSVASEAKTERIDTNRQSERATSGVDYLLSEIKRHRVGATALGAVLGLFLVVGLLWLGFGLWSGAKPNSGPPKFSEIMTTSNVREAAISSDGKYVAAVVLDSGKQNVTIQQANNASDSRVVAGGDDEYRGLVFSRDGYLLYYLARGNQTQALYQVSVLGGGARKVLDNINTPVGLSPDGSQFAFVRRKEGKTHLMIANADGRAEKALAASPSGFNFGVFANINNGPVWSPDGKVIACPTMSSEGTFHMKVVAVSVEDGSVKPIGSRQWFLIGQLGWLKDGSALIMDAQEKMPPQSTPQIWILDYSGGQARNLTNDLSFYHGVSMTADTNTLITTRTIQTSQIWIVSDFERGNAEAIPASKNKGSGGLTWTSDGRIVYASTESGVQEIWNMEEDGSNSQQLTFDKHTNVEPAVPRLGLKRLVYASYATGQPHIWTMDSNGKNLKQITNGNYEDWPDCSPDGQWAIYHSSDSSGEHIWKVPMDGGQAALLTDKPARHPVFSPDGKQIACFIREEGSPWRLAVLSANGGQPQKTFEVPATVADQWPGPRWSGDGQALTYIVTRGGISNIWSQPLSGGPATQLTNFNQDQIFAFAWSPDGKKLACVRGANTKTVILINDFSKS